jgi:hypothetical protein
MMRLIDASRAGLAAVAACALLLVSPSYSRAGLVVTVEAPGVQSTTIGSPVLVETFNARPLGPYTSISSAIGTYTSSSPGAVVVAANAFGGANQTRYISVGAQSAPTTAMDLTFFGPQSYFGLYWGAVDAQNSLEVYDGATLLSTITRSTFNSQLVNTGLPNGLGHFGNPNTGQNTSEPYAFINITGTAGTTFDRVRFVNNGTGTGFETDNHTVAVPEPTSMISAGIGLLGLAGYGLRRKKARAEG